MSTIVWNNFKVDSAVISLLDMQNFKLYVSAEIRNMHCHYRNKFATKVYFLFYHLARCTT